MSKKLFALLWTGILLLPTAVLAQNSSELGQVEDFGDLISKIWSWGFVVILSLSVTMIVIGGLLYMLSAGNEEKIDQARQIIDGALVAAGIVLFSAVIQRILSRPTENLAGPGGTLQLSQLPDAVKNGTNILLTMVGGLALVMLILNAYQYMSSRGDEEKLDHAKRGLTYSLIGLGVALGAFLILNTFIGIFRSA